MLELESRVLLSADLPGAGLAADLLDDVVTANTHDSIFSDRHSAGSTQAVPNRRAYGN